MSIIMRMVQKARKEQCHAGTNDDHRSVGVLIAAPAQYLPPLFSLGAIVYFSPRTHELDFGIASALLSSLSNQGVIKSHEKLKSGKWTGCRRTDACNRRLRERAGHQAARATAGTRGGCPAGRGRRGEHQGKDVRDRSGNGIARTYRYNLHDGNRTGAAACTDRTEHERAAIRPSRNIAQRQLANARPIELCPYCSAST